MEGVERVEREKIESRNRIEEGVREETEERGRERERHFQWQNLSPSFSFSSFVFLRPYKLSREPILVRKSSIRSTVSVAHQ